MDRDRLTALERFELERDPPRLPGPGVLDVVVAVLAILLAGVAILFFATPAETALPYCSDMGAGWLGWCR